MSPYDHARTNAERDPRRAETRRRRARTGVVIIDDDISWSTVPRRPRRVSGPVSRDLATRGNWDAGNEHADRPSDLRTGTAVLEADRFTGTDIEISPAAVAAAGGIDPAPGERRTVVITGRVADRYAPVRRGGYESSLRRHERSSFKPDRVALWAVLLGVLLVLIAAGSSHAATLAAHLPR